MKISMKAALLSALVFPGVGHIYLRRIVPGLALAGTSLAAVAYLVNNAFETALRISEQIQSGAVPIDMQAITELVSSQSSGADVMLQNLATAALIICWLFGIFDAYRVGRLRDQKR